MAEQATAGVTIDREPKDEAAAAFGPGIVLALAAIGPGDFVSNTAAGAVHGYNLLWVLALTLLFRFVWLNTTAKYVMVTGESLLEGFARAGKWVVWLCLGAMILLRHFRNLYKYPLMGECLDLLFPLPTASSPFVWSMISVISGFIMLYWGGYFAIEKFLKFLIVVMGRSLLLLAFFAHPQPGAILHGLLIPTLPGSQNGYSTFLVVLAVVGAGVGGLGDLGYSYFVDAKGWRRLSLLKRQRTDLLFSVFSMFLIGSLLQIVAAGTLRASGTIPENTSDLMRIFSDQFGYAGRVVFAFGLWGAAFSGYVASTTGSAMIVTDIVRRVIPVMRGNAPTGIGELRKDPVYRACIVFWCLSPLYVLFTPWRPVAVALVVSAAAVPAVPLTTWGLLKITNNEKLVGQFKNSRLTNGFLVAVILAAIIYMVKGAAGWLNS